LESGDGLKLGGELREISMIMSDLRGFTALTSVMPPEEVIAFLNRYLGKMVEILIDHRGTIDEIIGDGILAFFGAPEALEDHPAHAVACALRMQLEREEVNNENQSHGLSRLEMGIAVNTGEVVVGNIGSEKRAKYGAVGAQVNFTGRIESFTVGGQVLVSQAVYDRTSDILDVKNVLKVQMKGINEPVNLYDVRGIRGEYDISLPDREETGCEPMDPIEVRFQRLQAKTMTATEDRARVVLLSRNSAVILSSAPLHEWENLKMQLRQGHKGQVTGEVYAKVISVKHGPEGYEAEIRFTSVSAGASRIIEESVKGT
ncbi:MAG: adenylate/guanylate cyclase domain-containing protein, partial [Pseudomonadota bacterium]